MGKRALLVGVVLIVCFAAIALAADITGNWAGSITVGDNEYNLVYTFKQDGEKLSGTVARDGGEPVSLNDGKVQGDRVTFFVQADRGGTLTKYTMDGAIKGDETTAAVVRSYRIEFEFTLAFYRKVIPDISAPGLGTFTLVVDTAFLSSTVPPVAVSPGAGYTSQNDDFDTPGSGLLGVWATVVYRQSSALKPVTTYTQISQRTPVDSSLLVNATVNAIRVVSQSPTALMTLDAGVLAQSGARFTGSQVHMNANAASAGMGTGSSANGATAALSAPPSASQLFTSVGRRDLTADCQYVCIGSTTVAEAAVSASDTRPPCLCTWPSLGSRLEARPWHSQPLLGTGRLQPAAVAPRFSRSSVFIVFAVTNSLRSRPLASRS
jgi:hypothetical protein